MKDMLIAISNELLDNATNLSPAQTEKLRQERFQASFVFVHSSFIVFVFLFWMFNFDIFSGKNYNYKIYSEKREGKE